MDELRECGVTNMFGATVYIIEEFNIKKSEAHALLIEWMKTFAATSVKG